MVQGWLRPLGTPVIPFELAGQMYEAIIDTGFEGCLQLPSVFQTILGGTFVTRYPIQYGDGSIGFVDVFEIVIQFDGVDRAILVQYSASNELILGVEALKDYRLEINFAGGSVLLDRVTP